MKTRTTMTVVLSALLCVSACTQEKSRKDRSEATDMYERICNLTKEYTEKLESAPDSADWAEIGAEFEEKLDKISLGVAPDTDLLLTEGQNDTIHALMQKYVSVRRARIRGILHPEPETDSLDVNDSLTASEASEEHSVSAGASRSPGN